jgi:hypothetical protein
MDLATLTTDFHTIVFDDDMKWRVSGDDPDENRAMRRKVKDIVNVVAEEHTDGDPAINLVEEVATILGAKLTLYREPAQGERVEGLSTKD